MHQDQLKTLLQRYHDQTATPDEIALLNTWYHELSKTKDNFFRNEAEENQEIQFLWKQMEDKLALAPVKTLPFMRTSSINAIRKWAVAAAIAGLVTLGWLWYMSSNNVSGSKPAAISRVEQPVKDSSTQWVFHHNNNRKAIQVAMSDGSTVKLMPGARLRYKNNYPLAGRDLYLEGKAFFEVAKDKTKPFTVYAGPLTTTALGTSFWVQQTNEGCIIKLLTGKVVINTLTPSLQGWNRSVVLAPGQELRLDTFTHTVAVRSFQQKPTAFADHRPVDSGMEQLMTFDHTPLNKVFNKLQAHYHQTIEYDTAAMAHIHFSGAVLKNDSMPVILKAIAQINNLSIVTKPNGFVVSKNP